MRVVGKIVLFMLAGLGLVAAGVLVGGWLLVRGLVNTGLEATRLTPPPPTVPAVLTLDLSRSYDGKGGGKRALALGLSDPSLRDVTEALTRAAKDPTIKGLAATITPSGMGFADVQELRAAIAVFRQSGKPTFVFSHDLGMQATREYYLAAAFGDIWLQPSGTIGLTGFAAEVPFLAKALEDIGVAVTVGARYEYKDAVDPLIRTRMSDAQRVSTKRLLESWLLQVQQGVASDRHLTLAAVQALTQGPPLFAEEARKAGLVDHLGYADQAEEAIKAATGSDKKISLDDYIAAAPASRDNGPHVAYINASGTIQPGRSNGAAMGADTVARAIAQAVADASIKAVILHIDSPGGDYGASDTIWREVKRARDKHLPVIVSMGNVAASGGYFMAMPANQIIAQPGTITGSIGVFSLKPQLSKLWDKLDVHWDTVELGDYALMWSGNRPFTPAQAKFFDHMLDVIYLDFTGKLAQGRGFDARKVDDVARGRVWSGADAKAVGLVDGLGGLDTAIDAAKKEAGLAPGTEVTLVTFPKPKSQWQQVLEMLQNGDFSQFMTRLETLVSVSSTVVEDVSRLGLTRQGAALQTPALGLREK